MAVKTIVFQADHADTRAQLVAREAAIATNLAHKNVVATYSHDLTRVAAAGGVAGEAVVYKLYLIQVRSLVAKLRCSSWCLQTVGSARRSSRPFMLPSGRCALAQACAV